MRRPIVAELPLLSVPTPRANRLIGITSRAAWLVLAAWTFHQSVLGQNVTLGTATRALDVAGGRMTFTADVSYSGNAGYELTIELPRGWEYVSGEGEPAGRPFVGAQVNLVWFDHSEARPPGRISFAVQYPAGVTSASIVPTLALTRGLPFPTHVAFPNYEVFARAAGTPINFGPAVAPTIRYQPVNRTVGVEGTTWLKVTAEGTAPMRYQWRKNGLPIAGATSATYSNSSATLSDADTFDVIVANAAGSVTSRPATLTVKAVNPGQSAPVIDAQPIDTSATIGGLAVFSVTTFSNHLVSYQWRRSGVDIAGATGQSLVLPDTQPTDAGSYAVVVRNAHGATTSRTASLNVHQSATANEPPQIDEQPQDISAVMPEPGQLRVAASGTAPLHYQWFLNGVPIPGATLNVHDLSSALGGPTSGNFSVVVNNTLGAVRSRPAVVRLVSVDTAPSTTPSAQAERVVVGTTATLTAGPRGSPPFSYHWFKGDTPIQGATDASLTLPSVSTSDAGRYRAVITSLTGSAQHFVELTVVPPGTPANPPVIATTLADQTVSLEQTLTLNPSVDGTTPLQFQWIKDGQELPGATNRVLSINAAQFSDTGEYALKVTNAAGSAMGNTARIEVRPPSSPLAYQGPSGIPALVTQPRDANVPAATTAGFHVVARAETTPLRYQWRRNGIAIPGATNSVHAFTGIIPADAGYYSVVVWNARGATISRAARLEVGEVDPRSAEESARRRLRNVSTRASTSNGDAVMTAGFVINGTEPKPVLVRAVGPTLGLFGVQDRLSAARVELFRDRRSVATNSDWSAGAEAARSSAAAQRVGAFALPAGSKDAALFTTLQPGDYTATVTGGEGVALVEVYDASENETMAASRIVNLATRARTGPGDQTLSAGFVIVGSGPKRVLIRGIGPGLAAFGVESVLGDPQVRLFAGGRLIASNDNWEDGDGAADVAVVGAHVGAFPLDAESKDAALVAHLSPGTYTVQVTGVTNATGVALVEIYEAP